MVKRIFALITCLSLVFMVNAQTGKIKLSPEYKLPKNKTLQGHLHSNSSGHYMYFKEFKGMGRNKVSMVLEKYDPKFNELFSKKFTADKKNIYSLSMKYFKNKFAWLMYEKNKSDDYLKFFLTPIDLDGKSAKPKSIAKFKYERNRDFPNILWEVAKDTSKILFVAESDRDSKKENYEAFLSVIDNDFNTIWKKKVRLPYSQKRVDIKSWELTRDGKVYFVAKVYEDNKTKESKTKRVSKNKRKKTPAYDMVIYSLDGDMAKPAKYELKLKDAFVKGVKLRADEGSGLACVGFFGDSRRGPTQGVFYLKLSSEDGTTEFANKRRFTPKELAAFGDRNTSKDRKSKDSGLDASFRFDDIVTMDNGEIFAIAEENYIYVTSSTLNGVITYTTYYVSNSIIVINIDKEGVVDKVGIIPKRQTMRTPIFGSYTTLRKDGEIYFMYNDDKDNLRKNITDPDKIRRISSGKDCVAVLTTLDDKNKMDRKLLFTKKEAETLLMPTESAQINQNELFFFNLRPRALGKSKFRFGTMTVEGDSK